MPPFNPCHVVRELESIILADLRLEDVAISHIGIAWDVDGRDALIGRAGSPRDAERLEKIAVDIPGFLGSKIVDVAKAKIVDQRGLED